MLYKMPSMQTSERPRYVHRPRPQPPKAPHDAGTTLFFPLLNFFDSSKTDISSISPTQKLECRMRPYPPSSASSSARLSLSVSHYSPHLSAPSPPSNFFHMSIPLLPHPPSSVPIPRFSTPRDRKLTGVNAPSDPPRHRPMFPSLGTQRPGLCM